VRNIENIELIWNIACLFGRQTVSVSCGNLPTTNTAYLVGFRGRRKLIGICGKLRQWATEFVKLARKIWKNLLRKTAVPNYGVRIASHCVYIVQMREDRKPAVWNSLSPVTKVLLLSPLSRHIWQLNCSLLHTTRSSISFAVGASHSNFQHTAPPINVFDILHWYWMTSLLQCCYRTVMPPPQCMSESSRGIFWTSFVLNLHVALWSICWIMWCLMFNFAAHWFCVSYVVCQQILCLLCMMRFQFILPPNNIILQIYATQYTYDSIQVELFMNIMVLWTKWFKKLLKKVPQQMVKLCKKNYSGFFFNRTQCIICVYLPWQGNSWYFNWHFIVLTDYMLHWIITYCNA